MVSIVIPVIKGNTIVSYKIVIKKGNYKFITASYKRVIRKGCCKIICASYKIVIKKGRRLSFCCEIINYHVIASQIVVNSWRTMEPLCVYFQARRNLL